MIIESPYGGDVERNIDYAKACVRDALNRGEAPFASHLLYTQPGLLDATVPEERFLGIETGFVFRRVARRTAFYVDRGFSQGMALALEHVRKNGMLMTFRTLGPPWAMPVDE